MIELFEDGGSLVVGESAVNALPRATPKQTDENSIDYIRSSDGGELPQSSVGKHLHYNLTLY